MSFTCLRNNPAGYARRVSPHNQPWDWVFASTVEEGHAAIMARQSPETGGSPAAKRAGITKRVGWHATYSTLLRANVDIKVVQELLRHANCRITMEVYTQALSPAKRKAA
jgi:integrase